MLPVTPHPDADPAPAERLWRPARPGGQDGRMKAVPISKVMTTDPVTIDVVDALSDAYHALQGAPFQHIPVLDNSRPVGMISSTDILKLVYDIEGSDDAMLTTMLDHQFTIDDAMSSELVSLPESATVHDAAEVLAEGRLHSIVVVDLTGSLVGIVTSTDLVRFLRDL
jgi:CBS domain-containing membrane protein